MTYTVYEKISHTYFLFTYLLTFPTKTIAFLGHYFHNPNQNQKIQEMNLLMAHQKIGLIEKISPIKLYTKVKKSIEKNTNIRYNLIDEN